MKSLVLAAAASVPVFCCFPASAQQQNPQALLFTSAVVTLEVDKQCEVLNYEQAAALRYLSTTLSTVLKQAHGHDAVENSRAGLIEQVKAAGSGCLPRDGNENYWVNVDQGKVMADALIAAPAMMPPEIASCAAFKGGTSLTREELTAAKAASDTKYENSKYKPLYENLRDSVVPDVTLGCRAEGYAAIMEGAAYFISREDAHEGVDPEKLGSGSYFGRWRNKKDISSGLPSNAAITSVRTDDAPDGAVAYIRLVGKGNYATNGGIRLRPRGDWTARLSGSVNMFQIVAGGDTRFDFERTGGEGGFFGDSDFILSQAAIEQLLALPPETEVSFLYQGENAAYPSVFVDVLDEPAKATIAAMKQAIAWGAAPRP